MGLVDDLLDAAKQISSDVTDAFESKNYSNLKNSIGYRVMTAGDKFGREAALAAKKNKEEREAQEKKAPKKEGQPYTWENGAAWKKAQAGVKPPSAGMTYTPGTVKPKREIHRSNFLWKDVSKNTGVPSIVFGSIGLAINGLICLSMGINASLARFNLPRTIYVILFVIFALLTVFSGALLFSGIKKHNLVGRYYQYGDQVGDAEYFEVDNIAHRMGMSAKQFLNDLKKMIRAGFLPKAKLDRQETTLMLTDKAYDQYTATEKSRVERENEQRRQEEELKAQYGQYGEEVAGILAEGNAYIRRVREVNDLIPDTEEMSNRLYRLESIMHKIFEQVKKQPEQAPSLRRFMDYYLPTIEKLLNGYLDLDKQDSDSETIKKTKMEIEGAIDMVNDAFEKLLDSFFQDQAWDLSSDISVMKTMLTQDGLVE